MSAEPLSLDDPRWRLMRGGYRVIYDPRPAIRVLKADPAAKQAWAELWNELHHQGDVGEASYATVPHLVRIYETATEPHWNTYAIVAVIENRRTEPDNPPIPEDLRGAYEAALQRLAERGLAELPSASDPSLVMSILSILAFWKGRRALGRLASDFTDDELQEILDDPWHDED